MQRIAILVDALDKGGVERVVLTLARGLIKRGYDVDIVLFSPICEYPNDVPRKSRVIVLCGNLEWKNRTCRPTLGIEWYHSSMPISFYCSLKHISKLICSLVMEPWEIPSRRGLSRGVRLFHYLQNERPDIMIVNRRLPEYAVYYAKKMNSLFTFPPVLAIFHDVELGNSQMYQGSSVFWQRMSAIRKITWVLSARYRRRKILSRISDHVVAVSRGVAESLNNTMNIPIENLSVIYNPMDIYSIKHRTSEVPYHEWFTDNGPPIILGAGRLSREKDFETLINAYSLLRNVIQCRLIILGDGPLRVQLEEQVKKLGLVQQVSLPGWVENPWAYMSRSELFVLSSRQEALGNALIEALICSCKAVATDSPGGASEILNDSKLLAPVENPQKLANVMIREMDRLVNHSEFEIKTAKFSLDMVINQYETLMLELSKRGPTKNS